MKIRFVAILLTGSFLVCAAIGGRAESRPQNTSATSQSQSEIRALMEQRDKLSRETREKEALPLARKIVDFYRSKSPGSSDLGVALGELGDILSELRLYAEAEATLDEALQILTRTDGPESLAVARVLENQENWHYLQNQFAEADRLTKHVLSIFHKLAPNTDEEGQYILNAGITASFHGKLVEAKGHFNRALAIFEKLSPESISVSRALVALGSLEAEMRQFTEAQVHLDRAYKIEEKLEPESAVMADCLTTLGSIAVSHGKFDVAEKDMNRALAIRQKISTESTYYARSLENVGLMAQIRGHLTQAESYISQALAIQLRLAPESLDTATSYNTLGIIQASRGRLDLAQVSFEKSVSINAKLSPDSTGVASAYTNLSYIALQRGRLEESQKFGERSIEIFEKVAPGSLDVASNYVNLGNVAFQRGRLTEAQNFWERALQIQNRIAPEGPNTYRTLSNLGLVARTLGRFEQAEAYTERAHELQRKLEPGSSAEATLLSNLGAIAVDRGRYVESRAFYARALTIAEKNDPASSDTATCLTGLGTAALHENYLDDARIFYERALRIREESSPDSFDTGILLQNLGALNFSLGKLDDAKSYLAKSVELLNKIAPASVISAASLTDLGVVAEASGNYDDAKHFYGKALKIKEMLTPDSPSVGITLNDLLNLEGRLGHENEVAKILRQRAEYAGRLSARETSGTVEIPALNAEIGHIFSELGRIKNDAMASSFYAPFANLRGLGLSLEARSRTVERVESNNLPLRDAIAKRYNAGKAEESWIKSRTASISEAKFESRLVELRTASNEARSEVVRLLQKLDSRLGAPPVITLSKVQSKLPATDALVEFFRVERWNPTTSVVNGADYAAFVVRKKGPVHYVRLGDAAQIDSEIKKLGASLDGSSGDERHVSRLLFDSLIKPLGPLPESVLISPDSALNGLPFNALIDPRGRYLIETKSISMLGGGRDLVDPIQKGKAGPNAVFAAPAYETDPVTQALAVKRLQANIDANASPNRGGGGGKFEPLPSASIEGRLVGKALGVAPITGAAATEDRLYTLKHPRVLHIATHGVFYPPLRDSVSAQRVLDYSDSMASRLQVADEPMLRSALAFAGANEADELRKKGLNDGWATALEISQMDLAGTELVVLSGCDTGAGDVSASEGVFGLQRAFRFAGAQTLIMSLFAVPDSATQKLMARFYKNWKPGMSRGSKLKALRNAQLALLKDPKTRDPKNWAGFVLMGNR